MLSSLPEKYSVFREVIDQIKLPTDNDKIYKEECLITCDTVYAEKGLFICMANWKSFSYHILDSYVNSTKNTVFLNIHKIRHVKDRSA